MSGIGIKRPVNYNDLVRIAFFSSLPLAPPNYIPGVGRGAHGFVTQYFVFPSFYYVDRILVLPMLLKLFNFDY